MSANTKPSYRWLLWTLALLGCALDQAGKYGVFAMLHDEARANSNKAEQTVIPGALKLHVELSDAPLPADASPLKNWSGPYQPHVN